MKLPASAIDVVLSVVSTSKRIIDIGCGSGMFASSLASKGYQVAGIDPQQVAIDAAMVRVPEGEFRVAGAESIPFADGQFDAAAMIHSLHHVPLPLMRQSLMEALRCTREEAPIIVVEPLAAGSFHDVLRLFDDETAIRGQAQSALEAACREGVLRRESSWQWEHREAFSNADEFIRRATAVDPQRAIAAAARKLEIEQCIKLNGISQSGEYVLVQPIRADVFRHPA